jgi:LysR family glycine cleavage system transcriptional activator
MSPLPPLAAIRAFEAAGRHENFSRAAEELGLTQAAISYQIRQLEDRVGKPLFLREKGRVRLSEAGQLLLPAVTGGFSSIADAFEALRAEDSDVLSVNSSVSFGGTWLSGRIGRFQLRYPDLAVRISLDNQLIDFNRGTVDAAIRIGKGKWDGLRADFLIRQHFTPICSPGFLADNNIRTPEDLLKVDRLAPNDPMWAAWFAAAGIGQPPPLRRGVELDSQLQEASSIHAGYGIALLTPLYWRQDLASGRLVQPFPDLYMASNAHFLVHPENRVGVRKIERLREWLHSELDAERGDLPPDAWKELE